MIGTGPPTISRDRGQFGRDGFVLLPRVFDSQETERIRDLISAIPDLDAHDPTRSYSIDLDLYRRSPQLADFVRGGKPLMMARWALGSDAELLADRLFGARPGSRSHTFWHQDTPLSRDPLDAPLCVLWIALVDVPLSRAPLVVVPGSHRTQQPVFAESLRHNAERFNGAATIVDDSPDAIPDAQAIACCKGDVVILDGWTIHSSLPNHDIEARHAYTVRYRIQSTESYSTRARSPRSNSTTDNKQGDTS